MEMHQVRYFLAVARLLNFTRAADECNVTQPSLTRAIQKLEDELGGPLFRRERSRTHLTELGRLMQPHLERTFEAAQTAKALARDAAKAKVAPLALGIASIVEADALDDILAELARGLPGFELQLVSGSTEQLLEMAASGALDLLIVEAPDEAPDRFEAWALYAHRYHLLVREGHPLVRRDALAMRDASEEAWIDFGEENRRRLMESASRAGFEPDIRHSATDLRQAARLVSSGLGVALLPPPRDARRLQALPLSDVRLEKDVVLAAIAGRRRSVASDAFVRAARARSWTEPLPELS